MNVFLDTNIVLDYIERRGDFTIDAANIFQLSQNHLYNLFITDLTMVNVAYILRKKVTKGLLFEILTTIQSMVSIIDIGPEVISNAISIKHKDFEDSVQFLSAEQHEMDCIVTRNKKDFKGCKLNIYSPIEFLSLY